MIRLLFGLLVMLACFPTLSPAQVLSELADEQELIRLESAWNEAFYAKDVATIAGILAEEFVATYDDGRRGTRETELTQVVNFNQQVLSAVQRDFTVRVYGEAAVVWFTLDLEGMRDGEPARVQFRFTDVFVRRDGRWQCVSSQSTRIQAESE